tara:strand:+ start:97 stop:324 length:228 start_codon:yes stop_codon:yes gene_type:complete
MVKDATLHELCAVACEALDALKGATTHIQNRRDSLRIDALERHLQHRFTLALEELGPTWWLNFAEMNLDEKGNSR